VQVVILAGGRGTRIEEESATKPKPMVEIGGHPMLWHIMNIYTSHGYTDFLVACGYRGDLIKEYFHNLPIRQSDYIVDLATGERQMLTPPRYPWRVGVIDTGVETMTGGRIGRLADHLTDGPFMVTYGDGVGNVDIAELVAFHKRHGRKATVTAVRPPARFGGLLLEGNVVKDFSEKPQTGEGWINGGFFVFEPEVLEYLRDDKAILEREPMEQLAAAGELMAFQHDGFWQPMDTLRERHLLEQLWSSGQAPWKTWDENQGPPDNGATVTP